MDLLKAVRSVGTVAGEAALGDEAVLGRRLETVALVAR